ncbi:MAG: Holliday junction branch migration DNA helicase RuvB [Armatimonadetes bacterium]|nr:Holliday junction branch migration DNA helicase RuvB [Armatimonadota bacterium]
MSSRRPRKQPAAKTEAGEEPEALAAAAPEEREDKWNLRPRSFEECIGQRDVVAALDIAIRAAKERGEPLDHTLFYGPPGLGKTTFARIIANEMGVSFKGTSGPALERGGDLVSILTNLEEGDVLFIDEIHRLPRQVEELLYSAMEDFTVDIIFDKGAHARIYRSRLQPFTLVGATTRAGFLSPPLRQRFGLVRELHFYSEDELVGAIQRSANLLDVDVDPDSARVLALRSRGTIRIANRLLRRVRDYAQVKGGGEVSPELAQAALELEGIDEIGLTAIDRRLLEIVVHQHLGGPVGIEAIAATLQEEVQTLEDMVEPFLLHTGLLARTPKGRVATEAAYQHLGVEKVEGKRRRKGQRELL